MSRLRAGDPGLDLERVNLRTYRDLTITEQTSTTIAGDLRRIGQPGYVVRLTGAGLAGDVASGQLTGTLTGLRETLNGALT